MEQLYKKLEKIEHASVDIKKIKRKFALGKSGTDILLATGSATEIRTGYRLNSGKSHFGNKG